MLEQAVKCLDLGWSVIPCNPKAKVAAVPWKPYQTRKPTEQELRTWFPPNTARNIALVTGAISGVVVVDIDPRHGGTIEGHTPTRTVTTPRGGWHLYYRHPGLPVQNSAGAHGPGVDVRGDGGYVMIPPSALNEGVYKVSRDCEMAELPERFYSKVPIKPQEPQTVSSVVTEGVKEGGRNDAIAKLTGQFARMGMPMDTALASIQALNAGGERIVPPLPRSEVETTVKSIYSTHGRNNPVQDLRPNTNGDAPIGDFDVVPYGQYMSDNMPTPAQWLVEGWLLRETIAMLVAPPESYKTWIEFDLAVAVAGNRPFFHGVQAASTGSVLIIQQEDHPGQNVERLALLQHVRDDIPATKTYPDGTAVIEFPRELPIIFHPDSRLKFGDPKVMTALDKVLDQYRPALVIVDPLYSATSKTDDHMASTVQDMMILKDWRRAYGSTFLLGHHTSKGAAKARGRARGWGSVFLDGFLEQYIHLWKLDIGQQLILRHGSKRQGPEPTMHARLDICTHPHNERYSITAEEIGEDAAEALINPELTGVTKNGADRRKQEAPPPKALSPLAGEILKSVRHSGPMSLDAWASATGYTLADAKKAAKELLEDRRAFFSEGKLDVTL